jgi:hypothetical protein
MHRDSSFVTQWIVPVLAQTRYMIVYTPCGGEQKVTEVPERLSSLRDITCIGCLLAAFVFERSR